MNLVRNMIISALVLAAFAILGTTLVSFTYDNTHQQIAENKRQELLHTLHILIDPAAHDNDLYNDVIYLRDKALLGSNKPVAVYRARKHQQPVAAIIASVAPDGYSGNIELLVAIHYNGTLAGVRVIEHRETPGLGDAIDASRSDWILGFNGKSLNNPAPSGWKVKRDGGEFDQFTGATISPRAIVKAVHNTLLYYQQHRSEIFK